MKQVQLCLEVVWERPPYFAGRGINVKDNKEYLLLIYFILL